MDQLLEKSGKKNVILILQNMPTIHSLQVIKNSQYKEFCYPLQE